MFAHQLAEFPCMVHGQLTQSNVWSSTSTSVEQTQQAKVQAVDCITFVLTMLQLCHSYTKLRCEGDFYAIGLDQQAL